MRAPDSDPVMRRSIKRYDEWISYVTNRCSYAEAKIIVLESRSHALQLPSNVNNKQGGFEIQLIPLEDEIFTR